MTSDSNISTDTPALSTIEVCVETKILTGLLFIGDPHIEGRTPGFRRDNYPETILTKLTWCIEFADQHSLQPIFLGDVFDKPRDNPNWVMSRLLDILGDRRIPTIFGNHDCANPHLDENDSLMLLAKAGAVQLLDSSHLWACQIEGRSIVVSGSPYRYAIPERWSIDLDALRLVSKSNEANLDRAEWARAVSKPGLMIWLTHHDLTFPNLHEAVITQMNELPGIDYLINGHIHRRASAEVVRGQTTWVNPGNIARRSRSDSIRGHVPAVLRMDIASDGQWLHYVNVPHRDAAEVFHDLGAIEVEEDGSSQSSFVKGLALLQSRKTESGAGLMQFLKENVSQFDAEVADEILKLADTVLVEHTQHNESA